MKNDMIFGSLRAVALRCLTVFAGATMLLPAVANAAGSDPALLATGLVSQFSYSFPDTDRSAVFANKNVLVLVPHQDDEACILGGVFEQYAAYGSDVHVVFTTNGDYDGTNMAAVRMRESLDALAVCGIPAENAVFLGYGDQWKNGHIYHASGNKKMTSHAGATKTYGSDIREAYRPGQTYTRNNLKNDIRSVIEDLRPDTIFCIDFDGHKDHRCLSLLFEEVMGEMLKDIRDYTPEVFKGFGYSTGWHSEQDFYAENIISSVNKPRGPRMNEVNYYNWADRVRFPVAAEALGRLKTATSTYRMLSCYPSQLATGQAGAIINGDRVFWKRDTASLLYDATVEVSSGNGYLLTDFRIIDSADITKENPVFTGHVWSPRENDKVKSVTFTLGSEVTLSEIRLYDNPDAEANVLNAKVTLSNGRSFETGPLNPKGSVNRFRFEPIDGITGFTIELTEVEGKNAGLCEAEAYSASPASSFSLLKTINENDDFVYEYWISETGEERFSLYTYPDKLPDTLEGKYRLEYDPATGCMAEFSGNEIRVSCPPGKSFDLIVRDIENENVYDSVRISNPSKAHRILCRLMQHYEHFAGF